MPQGRKFKPKPFQRPRVNLDGAPRVWQDPIRLDQIEVGDIVPDYGEVTEIRRHEEYVSITFLFGKVLTGHANWNGLVFTRDRSADSE